MSLLEMRSPTKQAFDGGHLKEESAVDNIALAQKILEVSQREFALIVDFRAGLATGTAIRTSNDGETALAGRGREARLPVMQQFRPAERR